MREVGLKNVVFYDGEVRRVAKLLAQVGDQVRVDFDRDDPFGVFQEMSRERALAGTNFNDEWFTRGTGSARNTIEDRSANQEVLA